MDDDAMIRLSLRLPRDLHMQMTVMAAENHISLNAEIIRRLEQSMKITAVERKAKRDKSDPRRILEIQIEVAKSSRENIENEMHYYKLHLEHSDDELIKKVCKLAVSRGKYYLEELESTIEQKYRRLGALEALPDDQADLFAADEGDNSG